MFLTVSVNELTRRLKFLNSSAVVVVSGDNEINGIIFQLPASYEGGFDFSTATWRVTYTDTAGDDHKVLITETDESTGYPFWKFDDVINKGANGTVKFAFVVSNVDADTAAVSEKWNSLQGTFSVLKTVTGSNSDEEAEENTTYDRLASAVQAIREAQASVDNVGEVLASLTGSSPQVVDTVADLANIDTTQYLIAIVLADGYLYYYDGADWQQGFVYGSYELDTELPEDGGASGKAADSGLVGEEIGQLKADLSAMSTASASDVGKALKVKTVANGKVTEWEFGEAGGGGLTQSQKLAILNCFQHVAWTDAQGQTYYDELEDVLFPPAELTSISATYVNSNPVYADTDIDTLKQYITVTAHYSDSTTSVVNAYTLSGTLTVGTSTLTVTYSEMTTTISVTVSETPTSDMTGWSDGVAYTDIEVISDSYYNASGNPKNYSGWDRTGKIPCDGASTLVLKANGVSNIDKTFCWFFAQDESPLQGFDANPTQYSDVLVSVPANAYYFGISTNASALTAQLTQGIYPYA